MHPKDYSFIIRGIPLAVKEDSTQHVREPNALYALCSDMVDLPQECFVMFSLNSKNSVIDRHLVTIGLLDTSLVHPREIFRFAIHDNAAAILIAHNHPSGDSTPSAEDIRITRQIIEAGKIVDIKLLDHLVVGKPNNNSRGYTSLREAGLCEFGG